MPLQDCNHHNFVKFIYIVAQTPYQVTCGNLESANFFFFFNFFKKKFPCSANKLLIPRATDFEMEWNYQCLHFCFYNQPKTNTFAINTHVLSLHKAGFWTHYLLAAAAVAAVAAAWASMAERMVPLIVLRRSIAIVMGPTPPGTCRQLRKEKREKILDTMNLKTRDCNDLEYW